MMSDGLVVVRGKQTDRQSLLSQVGMMVCPLELMRDGHVAEDFLLLLAVGGLFGNVTQVVLVP